MAKLAKVLFVLMLTILPAAASEDGPRKSDPRPEFYFTRLMYSDVSGRGPLPGSPPPDSSTLGLMRGYGDGATRVFGSWMMDAWDADIQFMWGIQRLTNIKLSLEPHPMPIDSPDLFKYPYLYAVEVGRMELRDDEVEKLREYLLRGGFMHVDDFHGGWQFRQFQEQMQRVFPDRKIVDLPLTHEVFHTFYDIDKVIQVPNVGLGERYTASGGRYPTYEQSDDTQPRIMGISDDDGRLMVLITYNADYGDAWEWMDDPYYPAEFTTYAYRLGMNAIIYAMTH